MSNSSHSLEALARLPAGGPTGDEQSAALWAMSVEERVAAMRRGQVLARSANRVELCLRPQEVPLIASEFQYIARFETDYLGRLG